ncbi:sensor histidine kinase, partial [Bacteroidota bacterium]
YENIIKDKSKILDISRLIGKQNKHLNQLINHILDISIWEKEQFKLNKKEIKLLPFLKEKVEAFRIKYQTEEIKINEEYKFNTISIELDEFQITTAINNLLNNAVKYSDNSAEVSIFCYIDKELVIEISDKGIGLNAEQQKQIFDKFYRANTGNIHNVKGLGLGLYYVKKIIEAHKGRIEVISKVGKGSTFTIYLPL